MKIKKRAKLGFTLIEMMIVVTIIFILTAAGAKSYFYFKKNTDLNFTAQKIANLIRQTQSKAKAIEQDSVWGINIAKDKVVIFKGNDFANRNNSFDESIVLKNISSVSGKNQFIFDKFSGRPDGSGTLILDNGTETKNIQINAEGIVGF